MLKVVSIKDDLVSRLLKREHRGEDLEAGVREIIEQVKEYGDQGVLAATKKFDHADMSAAQMQVTEDEIKEAYAATAPDLLESLRLARDNISEFHARQHFQTWFQPGEDGELLGQIYRPLERVGIYVPGGTAAYPSSVLMNALPAKVAGVKEIISIPNNKPKTPAIRTAIQASCPASFAMRAGVINTMLAKIELANKKIAWRLDIFPCSMLILFLHLHSSALPGVNQSFQGTKCIFYSPGGIGNR